MIDSDDKSAKRARRMVRAGADHQRARRFLQAEQAYREALALDFDNADAWHLLGTLCLESMDFVAAYAHIAHALTLKPNVASYHHNVATALTSFGRFDEGQHHLREAIRLLPTYGEAYFHLSEIVKFQADDPLFEPVTRLADNSELSEWDRRFINFAAGKMYDDVGDPDRAFPHFAAGNRLAGLRHDRQGHKNYTGSLLRSYTPPLIERLSGAGLDTEVPIFIVGMPRSGTSLAEQILSSHSQVRGAGELPDIRQIAETMPKHLPDAGDYPACIAAATPALLQGFGKAYLDRLGELVGEAPRVVDKHPLNFHHLGLIALLFPRAHLVHMRRDPLDTCLSCFFQNFTRGQGYSFDLDDLGCFYREYDRVMTHWQRLLPGRILTLRYEDLVGDLEGTARRLLAFCGLDWEPGCLDFRRSAREVRTASKWQVCQPLYASSVGRWRAYRKHLGPLIEALGPLAGEAAAAEAD